MRWVFRSVLFLCLLILSGLSRVEASCCAGLVNPRLEFKIEQASGITNDEVSQNQGSIFFQKAPVLKKERIRFCTTEEDEETDDVPFGKKPARFSNYFTAYYAACHQYFTSRLTYKHRVQRHCSYTSSSRYLIFRVFRI